MFRNRISILVVSIWLCHFIESAKLPSIFKTCHRAETDFEVCLTANIEDALRKLTNGESGLGLPSIEPLEVPSITIGEGTGTVHVQQNFRNVKLHGLSNSKMIKTITSLDKDMLYAESVTPFMILEADYDLNGRILVLPIQGNGKCNVTMINMKVSHNMTGVRSVRKGKNYLVLSDYSIKLEPDSVSFKFDNLFNGNEQLAVEMNKVLNENWELVFDDVKAGYEQVLGEIFKSIANQVYRKVPIDEIYPN